MSKIVDKPAYVLAYVDENTKKGVTVGVYSKKEYDAAYKTYTELPHDFKGVFTVNRNQKGVSACNVKGNTFEKDYQILSNQALSAIK